MKEFKKVGVIYIFVNPAFPQFPKIGYADNVDDRLKQANDLTYVPMAYRIYATFDVSKRLADLDIHALLDKINPNLRVVSFTEHGKRRSREFYEKSPEELYQIIEMILKGKEWFGECRKYPESPNQILNINNAKISLSQTEYFSKEVIKQKNENFSFLKCGILPGSIINWYKDKNIICEVVDSRHIKYNGEIKYLTTVAKEIIYEKTGIKKYTGIQGPIYFEYKGKQLDWYYKQVQISNNHNLLEPKKDTEFNRSFVQKANKCRSNNLVMSKIGIKPGAVLKWTLNNSITCVVVDDSNVEYDGKLYSKTKLAKYLYSKFLNKNNISINGNKYFEYNGKVLWDIFKNQNN